MKSPGLLKTIAVCEYPAEFLVARLLGKKGSLFRNWEFLITSSNAAESLVHTVFYPYLKKYAEPGIWRFLRHEHLWVFTRMNNELRSSFGSYFIYHEINTLIVCLRYLESRKEIEAVSQELHNSLLHNDIQDLLTSSLDFAVLLQTLESRLSSYSPVFKGLLAQYEKKGSAALEVFLRDCFFAFLLSGQQPPMLKVLLQYLVDFHNCLSLAKNLRWQIESEPAMIAGGTMPTALFRKAYFRRDLVPVVKYLHLQDTDAATPVVPQLETALLRLISRKMKRWSLQRSVVGDILFYLWEQYRYARNISMVLNTMLLDDERVRESIVA